MLREGPMAERRRSASLRTQDDVYLSRPPLPNASILYVLRATKRMAPPLRTAVTTFHHRYQNPLRRGCPSQPSRSPPSSQSPSLTFAHSNLPTLSALRTLARLHLLHGPGRAASRWHDTVQLLTGTTPVTRGC